LVKDNDIIERWKEYFSKLLNEEYLGDTRVEEDTSLQEYTFLHRIRGVEVKEALKRMKTGKATGPDGIPIEVWKCLGEVGVSWLCRLFNKILVTKKMPDEWRRSIVVPIYKNKGDIQNCTNYRGIKLMSHTMKLWERIIEQRLRKKTKISENQFGFMPGRSTMEAIFSLRQLMEKYRAKRKNLHMVFIDLEKAYDRVPRNLIWWVLKKRNVPRGYIEILKDMYEGAITNVKTTCGETGGFPVTIGLHQGSSLSPYLFALIMDELTVHIQEEVPWCMLFADDIVLVDESREGVNAKLERWRRALESRGFKISRTKTEYMDCNFSGHIQSVETTVKIETHEIPRKDSFRYLGSMISKDGEIDEDVEHRIRAGWLKWRLASGVLCDRQMPTKLKGKFYRTVVRPAMTYGAECWPIKKTHIHKMDVAEMRMLRWMCGKTRKDKIRNERFREHLGVAPIGDKIRETRLRWFGHVERRPVMAPVRKSLDIQVEGPSRGRGRPKKTWMEVINSDLKKLHLSKDLAQNRTEWRNRIHVADPNMVGIRL
jgi:hypothetical protein